MAAEVAVDRRARAAASPRWSGVLVNGPDAEVAADALRPTKRARRAVGEAPLHAQLLDQPRREAAAEDRVRDLRRQQIGIAPRASRRCRCGSASASRRACRPSSTRRARHRSGAPDRVRRRRRRPASSRRTPPAGAADGVVRLHVADEHRGSCRSAGTSGRRSRGRRRA